MEAVLCNKLNTYTRITCFSVTEDLKSKTFNINLLNGSSFPGGCVVGGFVGGFVEGFVGGFVGGFVSGGVAGVEPIGVELKLNGVELDTEIRKDNVKYTSLNQCLYKISVL